MMQTFTKNELKWVYYAMEEQIAELNNTIQQADKEGNAFVGHVATCKRDGMLGTMHKISTALADGSKRIAIK